MRNNLKVVPEVYGYKVIACDDTKINDICSAISNFKKKSTRMKSVEIIFLVQLNLLSRKCSKYHTITCKAKFIHYCYH